MKTPTPGPHYLGAQNDILYIIAGAPPSPDNDHPFHERTDRQPLARVYDSTDGVPEGPANGRLFAAASELRDALHAVLKHGRKGRALTMARDALAKAGETP